MNTGIKYFKNGDREQKLTQIKLVKSDQSKNEVVGSCEVDLAAYAE